MRTTIDINDELMSELRRKAHEDGLSLKELINRVLRFGLRASKRSESSLKYRCPEFSLGLPRSFDLDKTLQLAEHLENDEIARKLKLRK